MKLGLRVAAFGLVGLMYGTASMMAQVGSGAPFATRDPHTCPDTKQPVKGAISAAQAKVYVMCEADHFLSGYLYLAENVTVEVGKGRAFNPLSEGFVKDIDTNALVFPIRGSYLDYQCSVSRGFPIENVGKNCNLTERPHAKGICYKSSFGDWACSMRDLDVDFRATKTGVPPPVK